MRRKEKPAIKGRAGEVFALDYGQLMGVPLCFSGPKKRLATAINASYYFHRKIRGGT
jgi:hypothetical protein